MLESNVKEDRDSLDLLYGCVLEWGLPLNLKYKNTEIDGHMIHIYDEGSLVACFDDDITDDVITAIAKMQPLRAVFKDSSFKNSPQKINLEERIKLMAPYTSIKVL